MAFDRGQPEARPAALGERCDGAAQAGRRSREPRRRVWLSDQLFGGDHEVEIAHGDSLYRLRVTALGKLILTK